MPIEERSWVKTAGMEWWYGKEKACAMRTAPRIGKFDQNPGGPRGSTCPLWNPLQPLTSSSSTSRNVLDGATAQLEALLQPKLDEVVAFPTIVSRKTANYQSISSGVGHIVTALLVLGLFTPFVFQYKSSDNHYAFWKDFIHCPQQNSDPPRTVHSRMLRENIIIF